MPPLIAPSLLAAPPLERGKAVKQAIEAGADRLHLDVMDGHFVPNLALSPDDVKAVCAASSIPTDVHIMASPIDRFLPLFLDIPCTSLTLHVEILETSRALEHVRNSGKECGLAIKPSTPLERLDPWLNFLDLIVLMGVEPGFGGQKFQINQLDRLQKLKERAHDHNFTIHVDGGVTCDLSQTLQAHGADVLVAGTSFFNDNPVQENMRKLRA